MQSNYEGASNSDPLAKTRSAAFPYVVNSGTLLRECGHLFARSVGTCVEVVEMRQSSGGARMG